jgi:hypothetical protein
MNKHIYEHKHPTWANGDFPGGEENPRDHENERRVEKPLSSFFQQGNSFCGNGRSFVPS